jgi:hypothetical protein
MAATLSQRGSNVPGSEENGALAVHSNLSTSAINRYD